MIGINGINLLKYMLNAPKSNLKTYLIKKFKTLDYKICIKKNYIYCVHRNSTLNVMLTAHYDTVSKAEEGRLLMYDKDQEMIWGMNGLGADDRAGIYAITEVTSVIKPKYILLCDFEESGGIGSKDFISDVKEIIDLNYIIALDRRGEDNYVSYSDENKDLHKFVESFGIKEEMGSFSDLSTLMPHLKIAGVNMGVGYHNEHSDNEVLDVISLNDTIERVKHILLDERTNIKYVYTPKKYEYGNWSNWRYEYGDDYGYGSRESQASYLYECPFHAIAVKDVDAKGFCQNCYGLNDCTARQMWVEDTEYLEELRAKSKLEEYKKSIVKLCENKTVPKSTLTSFHEVIINDTVKVVDNTTQKVFGYGVVEDMADCEIGSGSTMIDRWLAVKYLVTGEGKPLEPNSQEVVWISERENISLIKMDYKKGDTVEISNTKQ